MKKTLEGLLTFIVAASMNACTPICKNEEISENVYHVQGEGEPEEKVNLIFVPANYNGDTDLFMQDACDMSDKIASGDFFGDHLNEMNTYSIIEELGDCLLEYDLVTPACDDYLLKTRLTERIDFFDENRDVPIVIFNEEDIKNKGDHGVVKVERECSSNLVVHELGHAFSDLMDEEVKADVDAEVVPYGVNCAMDVPGYTCEEKWGDIGGVGCYEGCNMANWFRPTDHSCIMNGADYDKFCPVCRGHMEEVLEVRLNGEYVGIE